MQPFIITFCLVVAVIMVVPSLRSIHASRKILDSWIRVDDARILECKIAPQVFWTWPVVVYEYRASDVAYIGEDMPAIPTLGIRVARFRQRFQTGGRLVVYVDPDDHQISTIAPDRLSRLGGFGLAAATICLGFACLAGLSGGCSHAAF